MTSPDRLRFSTALTRLKKHERDRDALTLAAALRQQQAADEEVARWESRLAELETDHRERLHSGRTLDLLLMDQARHAIDGARAGLARARAHRTDCCTRSDTARDATAQAGRRYQWAEDWQGKLRQAHCHEHETREFTDALDAQAALQERTHADD